MKIQLCEETKRLIINAAFLLSTANSTNSKRKCLFSFVKDQETEPERTRSHIAEHIAEGVLLFSREVSDDSILILKKCVIYPHLNAVVLRLLCVLASSAPVE